MSAQRILVIEDNPTTRKMLRVALETEGFDVVESEDGASALAAAAAQPLDLVLQDIVLPDSDGFDVARKLRELPGGTDLPIVALTGLLSRMEEAPASAFDQILVKPVEPSRLIATVRAILPDDQSKRVAHGAGRTVLLVDDDPIQLKLSRVVLTEAGFDVTTATSGGEALEAARRAAPDAILSDVMMPGIDGFTLCRLVRNDPELKNLTLVLVSSHYIEGEDEAFARKAGADALVSRSPDIREALRALEHPARRTVSATPDSSGLSEEHLARVLRQLERQARTNGELKREHALQRSILNVTRRLSEILGTQSNTGRALQEVLYTVLDGCEGNAAALYVLDSAGQLRMVANLGLEDSTAADFFGARDLLDEVLTTGQVLPLSDAERGAELLEAAGAGAGLIVPVCAQGQRIGALFLAFPGPERLDPSRAEFARAVGNQIGPSMALRRTFLELARSQRQYRALFEGAHDAVAVLTPDGTVLDVNGQCESLLGIPRDRLVGKHASDFAISGGAEDLMAEFRRSMASHRPLSAIHVQHADGSVRQVEFSSSVVQVDGADIVFAIGRDVTESVAAGKKIRASEAQYRSLVDHIPDVVCSAALDGTAVFVSARVEPVCGLTPDEVVVGGPEIWFGRIHPDDRAEVEARYRALGTDGKPFDVEYRWQRKDGEWVWLLDRSFAISERGGARQVDRLISDVTARRRLEEQLRQAQKMDAIGQLVGGIAHDFNNVLAAILANTHFLLRALDERDPLRTDAEEIKRAADRAAALTRQLLAFSRRQVLEPRVVDLGIIVQGLEKMLDRLIGEDIELDVRLSPDLGTVRADVGQLEQVLVNLAVNARDAMAGGGTLTLETSNVEVDAAYSASHISLVPGRYVMLAVSDTGHGMDAETKRHIFEPFFTTKEKGKGTGLGLSTCYGIVKQSGGHIWVYSEPGRGSVFKIFLPLVEQGLACAPKIREAAARGGSETVLLIEDDLAVRTAVSRLLSAGGYRVVPARNGEEARALVEVLGDGIDLVLSDVVMPGSCGPDVVKLIQARHPRAKALFMSGYTDHAVLHHGGLPPGMHFIQKPFTSESLARKLREVLDD